MENPDADGSALGFLIFLFFNLNFQLCALLQCNRGISMLEKKQDKEFSCNLFIIFGQECQIYKVSKNQ